MTTRVCRQDFTGRLDARARTPQGGLRLPAYVTRTGVLTYQQPDGSVVRELRHPDDVFKTDSLATLAGAPVTIGHPGKVAPENYRNYSVGHVGDDVERKDDRYVATHIRVQDAKAVAQVEKGELLEISCGYDCDAVPEKGEYNGEKYDARQTNIVYNHVALLPPNHGRAGNDVRIRFDGVAGDGTLDEAKLSAHPMNEFEKKIAELAAEKAALEAKCAAQTARADAAEKTADQVRGERDALQTKVNELADTTRFDAAVAARVKLHEDAKAFGVTPSATERETIVACLTKADANFRCDDKTSMDYLRGRFDIEAALTAKGRESVAKVRADAEGASSAPVKNPVDEARARQDERSRNAWKGARN